jgi:hypothetical protein
MRGGRPVSQVIIITSDIEEHRVGAWALEGDGHEVTFAGVDDAEIVVRRIQPDLLILNTGLAPPERVILLSRLKSASWRSKVMEIVDGAQPTALSDGAIRQPYMIADFAYEVARILSEPPRSP